MKSIEKEAILHLFLFAVLVGLIYLCRFFDWITIGILLITAAICSGAYCIRMAIDVAYSWREEICSLPFSKSKFMRLVQKARLWLNQDDR